MKNAPLVGTYATKICIENVKSLCFTYLSSTVQYLRHHIIKHALVLVVSTVQSIQRQKTTVKKAESL